MTWAGDTASGLIPAHAGKTDIDGLRLSHLQAHPRSRGENVHDEAANRGAEGSSPLTRGKHAAPHSTREQIGLIPAHAGKTVRSAAVLVLIRAHPRSRGEN